MHKVLQAKSKEEGKLSINSRNESKKENEPRKVMVRNTEVKNFQNIVDYRRGDNKYPQNDSCEDLENKCFKAQNREKTILAEPRLLTSLKIVESIQNITEKGTRIIKVCSTQRETNGTKNKANRKVNIPFDEKVYKGLIDLHINDEDLGIYVHTPVKPKEFNKTKDPEPLLSDFYKPSFEKEFVVKPNVPKFEVESIIFEENSTVLNASRLWEPEDISYL